MAKKFIKMGRDKENQAYLHCTNLTAYQEARAKYKHYRHMDVEMVTIYTY